LECPWFLQEKTGVKFAWNECTWHNTHRAGIFHIPSAVIDFKYQFLVNVNIFAKKDTSLKLNAGDPLVHILPLSENNVVLKHHLVSQTEYDRFQNIYIESIGYKNAREIRKDLKFNTKAKCPFGFGK
jgi:hypothetical protein